MNYYKINYAIPGVDTFMPLYTGIMAGSEQGAVDTFKAWWPTYHVCHCERSDFNCNGLYSRYFKNGSNG